MGEIVPSVGRIVHYVSYGSPVEANGWQRYSSECRAAIITEVEVNGTVNVAVLNPTGLFFDQGLRQDDNNHEAGTWHWPERV